MEEQEGKPGQLIISGLDESLIFFEIFTRISGDILQKKFKYLCKQWMNIISNPVFIHTQTLRSEHGILQEAGPMKKGKMVLRFMNLKGLETREAQYLMTYPKSWSVVSLCNGLLLCRDLRTNALNVVNPTTKKIISLPPCKNYIHCRSRCNLVFVPSTKKYKVVDMHYDRETRCWVFHTRTLGGCLTESWTRVEEPSCKSALSFFSYYERVSIDGTLYLNVYAGNPILSFDVGNETTVRLLNPPNHLKRVYQCMSLREICGSLAFFGGSYGWYPNDVWILKDASREVWVKQYSIGTFPADIKVCWLRVLGILHNGEVIVFDDDTETGEILVYYVGTRHWKKIVIGKEFRERKCCNHTHVNSLVSVKNLK